MLAVGRRGGRFGFGAPVLHRCAGIRFTRHARIQAEGGAHVAEVVSVVRGTFAQAQ
jgi:hypothetical protein